MSMNMDKKTIIVIAGIIIFLIMGIISAIHILLPALDPVTKDMVKIFCYGGASGLLAGFWLGRKVEKRFGKPR